MRLSWVSALACCLLIFGCTKPLPTTVSVHGRVTWQGKPLTSGTVTFQPMETGEGKPLRPATGVLNSDGTYRLSTFRAHDGAMPGKYAIVIHDTAPPPMEAFGPAPTSLIPRKYGNSTTSGLTVTVPEDASGSIEQNFDLVD